MVETAGGAEDDEPDKMVIAVQRIGRFKRWVGRSIINFFVGIKNGIVNLVTGKKSRSTDSTLEVVEEKGCQGENGDLKNRGLDVKINHIDIPMGDLDKNGSNYADSSIGEGMDITIQGANGHVKQQEKDNISNGSRDSGWHHQKKGGLLIPDMDKSTFNFADSSIGEGMDITIQGEAEDGGVKESCADSLHSGDSGWRRSKSKNKGSITGSMDKIEFNGDHSDYDDYPANMDEIKHVEEVMYDPIDEIVVVDCCPPACYRVCPCCIGDPDSPFWQLWYKHRLQVSR